MHIQHRADLEAIRVSAHNLSRVPQPVQYGSAYHIMRLIAGISGVTQAELMQSNRGKLRVARSRQVAMYLMHVALSYTMKEVGAFFGRDRTTVAHACARIEDRRDDPAFEAMMCDLEARLGTARSQRAGILFETTESGEGV